MQKDQKADLEMNSIIHKVKSLQNIQMKNVFQNIKQFFIRGKIFTIILGFRRKNKILYNNKIYKKNMPILGFQIQHRQRELIPICVGSILVNFLPVFKKYYTIIIQHQIQHYCSNIKDSTNI